MEQKIRNFQQSEKTKRTDIWISYDFSKAIQEEKKLLVPYMKQAREQSARATLRYNELLINGNKYRLEDLKNNENQNEKKTNSCRTLPRK